MDEIRIWNHDAMQMLCFIFIAVKDPKCRTWNPNIDLGVLNYSKLCTHFLNGNFVEFVSDFFWANQEQ